MINVTPVKLDFEIVSGDSFHWAGTIKVDGLPLDLTGCKARFQGRRMPDDATPTIDLSTENGGVALGGALGTFAVSAKPQTVRGWGRLPIQYSFEIEDSALEVQTFTYGDFAIKAEWSK